LFFMIFNKLFWYHFETWTFFCSSVNSLKIVFRLLNIYLFIYLKTFTFISFQIFQVNIFSSSDSSQESLKELKLFKIKQIKQNWKFKINANYQIKQNWKFKINTNHKLWTAGLNCSMFVMSFISEGTRCVSTTCRCFGGHAHLRTLYIPFLRC